jgi:tetratricopeptide (TPR) repeat protein
VAAGTTSAAPSSASPEQQVTGVTRLEQLQKLAALQPGDPLTQYAIGLEYSQLERWAEAIAAFEQTLAIDPQYSPVYYQKARAELKQGQRGAAAKTLQAGIIVTHARGETHAESELRKVLETLI